MNEIQVDHWPKPIPVRKFDFRAARDNWEPGDPQGYGATEEEAIQDLLEQEGNHAEKND